jgi:CubicO group peptidase (beta-lactamase class C family)
VPEAEVPAPAALDHITSLLDSAVAHGRIPGLVAMAGRGPAIVRQWVAGQADTGQADTSPARPMRAGTVFDLASLTKVVATTTVTLALAGQGLLALEDPVRTYLPQFPAGQGSPVTIWHLLTHTSGLPGGRKFYRWCQSRAELLSEVYQTPLEAPPGERVVYSDLGFMALGEVLATVTGSPLDQVTARLVTGPLGLTGTGFNPPGPPGRFAATEVIAPGAAWCGTVHDENARLMGGVAGHAGLFAPAADLARFAAWWVSDADTVIPAALRSTAATCQTPGDPAPGGPAPATRGRRGLGWVCPGDAFDILGGSWPATSVSHTGFTGTSLALDPASGLWLVLLTNAVHAGRDPAAIVALRRAVHAALAANPPGAAPPAVTPPTATPP